MPLVAPDSGPFLSLPLPQTAWSYLFFGVFDSRFVGLFFGSNDALLFTLWGEFFQD